MLTLNEIKNCLADVRYTAIAEKTGLNARQIRHAIKKSNNPPYLTVIKLAEYIEKYILKKIN
jgi:DNA-binding phage protein